MKLTDLRYADFRKPLQLAQLTPMSTDALRLLLRRLVDYRSRVLLDAKQHKRTPLAPHPDGRQRRGKVDPLRHFKSQLFANVQLVRAELLARHEPKPRARPRTRTQLTERIATLRAELAELEQLLAQLEAGPDLRIKARREKRLARVDALAAENPLRGYQYALELAAYERRQLSPDALLLEELAARADRLRRHAPDGRRRLTTRRPRRRAAE